MKLDADDIVVGAELTTSNDEKNDVCVFTTTGRALKYPVNLIPVVGKNASGVKNTNAEEHIAAVFVDFKTKEFACVIANNGCKRIKLNDIPSGNRTNSPKYILSQVKSNPIAVINAFGVNSNDLINYVDASNILAYIKASDVTIGTTESRVSAISNHTMQNANLCTDINKTKNIFEV
jgi:topoisomerase-4 subunit A